MIRLARRLSSQSVGQRPVVFTGLLLLCAPFIAAPAQRQPHVTRMAVYKLRAAAQRDRDREAAESALAEGQRLSAQGMKKSKEAANRKFEEARRLFHAVGDAEKEASSLNRLGETSLSLGELQKAQECFDQALALSRAVNSRDGEAEALNNLGEACYASGDRQKSLDYFNQALALFLSLGKRNEEANTLGNIGFVHHSLGENQRGLDYLNQSLQLLRALGNRKLEALMLNNIGVVYESLGEEQKALDCYQQALPLHQAVGNRDDEAVTLGNIGFVYDRLGEKQRALDHYQQALLLHRAMGDRLKEAVALNNIGLLYDSLGEGERALDYYQQSLSLRRAVGDRDGEATTLNNIGLLYDAAGEEGKALDNLTRALQLHQSAGNRNAEATVLSNIGVVYNHFGEKRKALDYLNRALPLHRAVGNRTGESITLHDLGLLTDSLGEKQKALDYCQQSLSLTRTISYPEGEAYALLCQARANRDLGNLAEARRQVETSLNITESLRRKVAGQQLRSSFLASVQSRYELYIDLLMQLHQQQPGEGNDAVALQASERARARGLLELLIEANADIRRGVDPGLLARERTLQNQLNARAAAQTALLSGKHNEAQAEAAAKEVAAIAAQLQEVEAQIRATSQGYAALTQPQPLGVAEIQRQVLDDDTLLLEYALGDERSYLWAVTPDSITSYRLPPRAEVEGAARKVYELMTAREGRVGETDAQLHARVKAADAEYPTQASALSRLLLGPAASQLGRKRLLIVAPGALEYLPFAALPAPAISNQTTGSEQQAPSHDQPLMAEHEIVSLPSASALSVIRGEIAGRQLAANTVAVLADPVFELNDQRVTARSQGGGASSSGQPQQQASPSRSLPSEFERAVRSMRPNAQTALPRLPFTRDEADAILAVAVSGARLKALDFRANRAMAMSDELSRYRIIHFATHGLLNSEHPELSGLVFSLIDEQGRPQNGFLRLHEIYNLRLPAELVVLSACQSGLGKQIKGEGLVGLTRGFMYAGAPRVVASLWQVNDLATAELMKRFYRGMLKDGLRPAAALRAAQIEMFNQKQWSSPYFWAAFVIQGEWK
jgi:CHAT domain-containing protein/tetratricopeptide (TPR) repeat protein